MSSQVAFRKNKYILSIQDNLTKFIFLYPLKNKEASGVVKALTRYIYVYTFLYKNDEHENI